MGLKDIVVERNFGKPYSTWLTSENILLAYILKTLKEKGETYGYEIRRTIAEKSLVTLDKSYTWIFTNSLIYRIFDRLEQQGVIKSEWDDPNKKTKKICRYIKTEENDKMIDEVITNVGNALTAMSIIYTRFANEIAGPKAIDAIKKELQYLEEFEGTDTDKSQE